MDHNLVKHQDRSLLETEAWENKKKNDLRFILSHAVHLLRQSHKHDPSGWQRREERKPEQLKAVAFAEEAAVGDWWGAARGTGRQRSPGSAGETSRGSEGQRCVTTGALQGHAASSQAPAPCPRQGSHRAWLWKALLGGSTAVFWHSSWAQHHRVTHTTAGKAQGLREAWKCHYKLECSTWEGWIQQSHSQDKWTYLADRKKTVWINTSHEVVRKLKASCHTTRGANQDQSAIKKQSSCPCYFITYIYREHRYIHIYPHTYIVPCA